MNGRLIVVLVLYQPIVHKQWSIACLELHLLLPKKMLSNTGVGSILNVFFVLMLQPRRRYRSYFAALSWISGTLGFISGIRG
ncbi:hypothetical protein ACT691_19575 [Vibrio metschnikovii]